MTVTLQLVVAAVMTEVGGSMGGVVRVELDPQLAGINVQAYVGHSGLSGSTQMSGQARPCHSVDVA